MTNIDQLREHHGPFFDHWRRRMQAAFGISLGDVEPVEVPADAGPSKRPT